MKNGMAKVQLRIFTADVIHENGERETFTSSDVKNGQAELRGYLRDKPKALAGKGEIVKKWYLLNVEDVLSLGTEMIKESRGITNE